MYQQSESAGALIRNKSFLLVHTEVIWGQNLFSGHMYARTVKQKCGPASHKIQISINKNTEWNK